MIIVQLGVEGFGIMAFLASLGFAAVYVLPVAAPVLPQTHYKQACGAGIRRPRGVSGLVDLPQLPQSAACGRGCSEGAQPDGRVTTGADPPPGESVGPNKPLVNSVATNSNLIARVAKRIPVPSRLELLSVFAAREWQATGPRVLPLVRDARSVLQSVLARTIPYI